MIHEVIFSIYLKYLQNVFDKYLYVETEVKEKQRALIDSLINSSVNSSAVEKRLLLKEILLNTENVQYPIIGSLSSSSKKPLHDDVPLGKNTLLNLAKIAVNLPTLYSQYVFRLWIL